MELAEFLLARIAEDEADAEKSFGVETGKGTWYDWVLAECEAKRGIVEEHKPGRFRPYPPGSPPAASYACFRCFAAEPCKTLRLLALPAADHPDYQPEWAI